MTEIRDVGHKLEDELERFKANPTIEQYLRLRREYPGVDVPVLRFGGLDPLFALEPELKQHGIDATLVAGALDADPKDVDGLCLQLLEALNDRRRRESQGETALQARNEAIPDSLIDYLVTFILEAMKSNGKEFVPGSLVMLLRERLLGPNPAYHKAYEKQQRRKDAAFLAAQLLLRGEECSVRGVAKIMDIEPSTVSRWFPNNSLRIEAERIRRLLPDEEWLRMLEERFSEDNSSRQVSSNQVDQT
jgi:hypothetical protein